MSGTEKMYLEFLAMAYGVFWLLLWGFTYRTHKRAMQLEREVRLLQRYFGLESPAAAAQTVQESPLPGPSV